MKRNWEGSSARARNTVYPRDPDNFFEKMEDYFTDGQGFGDLILAGDIGFGRMSEEQLEEARRIFDKLDKDKDEKLSRDEMQAGAQHYGLNATASELNLMLSEISEKKRDEEEEKQNRVLAALQKGSKVKKAVKEKQDEKRDKYEFGDFLTILHMVLKHGPNNEAELLDAFETFDAEGTGHITADKLKEVLTSMGNEPMTEEEVCVCDVCTCAGVSVSKCVAKCVRDCKGQ